MSKINTIKLVPAILGIMCTGRSDATSGYNASLIIGGTAVAYLAVTCYRQSQTVQELSANLEQVTADRDRGMGLLEQVTRDTEEHKNFIAELMKKHETTVNSLLTRLAEGRIERDTKIEELMTRIRGLEEEIIEELMTRIRGLEEEINLVREQRCAAEAARDEARKEARDEARKEREAARDEAEAGR